MHARSHVWQDHRHSCEEDSLNIVIEQVNLAGHFERERGIRVFEANCSKQLILCMILSRILHNVLCVCTFVLLSCVPVQLFQLPQRELGKLEDIGKDKVSLLILLIINYYIGIMHGKSGIFVSMLWFVKYNRLLMGFELNAVLLSVYHITCIHCAFYRLYF